MLGGVEGREVLQVDVAGGAEVRRGRDAEQAVLHLVVGVAGLLAARAAVAVDRERAGARDAAVLDARVLRRVEDVHAAAAHADVRVRVVEDAAERRQVEQVAALESVRQSPRPMYMTQPLEAIVRPCDSPLVARPVAVGPDADELGGLVVGVDGRLAVAAHEAGGPLERSEQVLLEVRLGVRRLDTAHAGVEGAAVAVVATPGDRPVGAADGRAVAGRRGRRVVARDGVDRAGRARRPRVPEVAAVPQQRQVAGGRVHAVAGDDRLLRRRRRVVVRARADQAVDEARARLDRRGRADAEEAVAVLDEVLQRRLTRGVEHVARRR